MSECQGCGTKLENCGAPIWEDYCPNKECHYEAEQFKIRLRKSGEEMRKKKALEAAAPELYEALKAWVDAIENDHSTSYVYFISLAALAKARGELG